MPPPQLAALSKTDLLLILVGQRLAAQALRDELVTSPDMDRRISEITANIAAVKQLPEQAKD